MTLQQLMSFISVAQTKNFSTSAKLLYLSQPTLSNQIKALEKEIGYELFSRLNNGIVLTEAGEVFLEEAQYIIAHYEKIKKKLYTIKKRKDEILQIGYTDSFELKSIMPFLTKLKENRENIQLDLRIGERMTLLHALKDNELDLVVTYSLEQEKETSFQFCTLFSTKTNKLLLAMPKNHPLASLKSCTLLDIKENDVLWIDHGLSSDMFEFEKKAMTSLDKITLKECPTLYDALILCEGGFGLTLLPDYMIPSNSSLAYVPIMELPAGKFGFCYNEDCSDLLKELVQSI